MAAPYDYNNTNNNGYNADPVNRAPSPYHQQQAPNDYYSQHPQQFDHAVQPPQASPYSEGPTPASEGGEGERGILGAFAGGASGGYVGHQTCHGFLGTVGGAIVGSLTEDWAKRKASSRPGSRPCSPKPPQTTVCPPANGGCNTGHPGPYGQPLVHSQTTMSSHTDINVPGGMGHHHYPSQPAGPPSYGHPAKPCGHTHTCACQWFGKH